MTSADFFESIHVDPINPGLAVTACIESGARALLLDAAALPPTFFDVSTGVLGEILHRLTVYGIRMAVVVEHPEHHSAAFQSFVWEANQGKQFRFVPTREAAIQWLTEA